ncbi:MAG: tetratricopeptide repeat protein [Proteobacteria bacterium]|nr:tetratricopeptide repeat protein [Pseudomonadota bacterium]
MTDYSLGDAARILKVSPGRLRYWRRTALVRIRSSLEPTQDARTSLEFRDLVCLKAMLGLIEQGIPLRRIRRSVETLRERMPELEDPLGQLRLWAEGSPRVVVDHDGTLLEPNGQLVLDFREPTLDGSEVSPIERPRAGADPEHRALEAFERGCELDSDPVTYEEATRAYESAIEADPKFADAHCNLGAVLYNRGDRGRARRCFERCLEIEKAHVEANFNLANLLEEADEAEHALRHYREAIDADPLYADIHVNLALLYEKMSLKRRALEHWRRYLQLEPQGAWAEVARQRLS